MKPTSRLRGPLLCPLSHQNPSQAHDGAAGVLCRKEEEARCGKVWTVVDGGAGTKIETSQQRGNLVRYRDKTARTNVLIPPNYHRSNASLVIHFLLCVSGRSCSYEKKSNLQGMRELVIA
jgi:hypothetical protein